MPFVLLALPYVLQLLCLIHIIKTHRNSSWLWIVIMIPYAGGIAYLLIELLPELLRPGKIDGLKDALTEIVKPDAKFEVIKKKAEYSATYKNMLEYADALMEKQDYQTALGIYIDQNRGAFKDDPELLYRIAGAKYRTGDYQGARADLEALFASNPALRSGSKENLLFLRLLERIEDASLVKSEYQKTLQRIQNNSIELQYIDFLISTDDRPELVALFDKLRQDEQSMKINRVRYDRSFYTAVRRLEKQVRGS